MAKKKPNSQRKHGSGRRSIGRIVAVILALALIVASGIVFGPRLVHHCDNCDKLFVGTGYYANAVTNAITALGGHEDKILCRDCAETNHAIEILAGKSLEDFRRPLFESDEE